MKQVLVFIFSAWPLFAQGSFAPVQPVDMRAVTTMPVQTGLLASRPTTCTVGQMYFSYDSPAGQNLYYCTATNVWSLGSGGTPGPQGIPGTAGAPGAAGTAGTAGAPGAAGTPGTAGATGATGAAGTNGAPGVKGDPGATGPAAGGSGIYGSIAGNVRDQADLVLALNQTERNICTMGAACDGVTDDTATINAQFVLGGVVTIPPGKTVVASNLTPGSNDTLRIKAGAKLLKTPGSTTTYLLHPTPGSVNVSIECENGGMIDGNSVLQTTGQKKYLFIESQTNFRHNGCTYHNTGTPQILMGGMTIYNSSGNLTNLTSDTTQLGTFINMDCALTNKRVLIEGINSDSIRANVVYISNTGANEGICNALVRNVYALNTGDSTNGTGPNGNVVVVFRADGVQVTNIWAKGIAHSAVRIDASAHTISSHVYCEGAAESCGYAELGAWDNTFDHWIMYNSMAGLNLSNVSQRTIDLPNRADNIACTNMLAYCVAIEHDSARAINCESVPLCVILGTDATSHDNFVDGVINTHVNAAWPPSLTAVATASSINTGVADYLMGIVSIGHTLAPTFPISVPGGAVVTAITNANPALVTYSVGSLPVTGNTYCFYQIPGMQEINGRCGLVTSPTATNFKVGIDTTGFTAYAMAPGSSPAGKALNIYSSGTTPSYSASAKLHTQALP